MRESQIIPFAAAIPGGPKEVADLELGYQKRHSPGGRLRATVRSSFVHHASGTRRMIAPAAFRRPLRKYLVNSAESLSRVVLRFEVSSFDPRLNYIFRKPGGAVGATATQIDDILGCGEPDLLLKESCFSER